MKHITWKGPSRFALAALLASGCWNTAQAQTAAPAEEEAGIQEIVVTAQKRGQSG